ncbi:MAG: HNH endonuclease [Bacilli bacterium]|nr:HNH endonuclease [Bacilli bacterium]
MNPATVFLIVILISPAIFLGIFIPISVFKKKYRKFVETHSIALKQLKEINNKYSFYAIKNFDMKHSYDNENMYEDISCRDYLTYELVNYQKQINKALKDTLENKILFNQYSKEIKDALVFGEYDADKLLKNVKRLNKFEKTIVSKNLKTPTIDFSIDVRLRLTKINGAYRTSKRATFYPKEIKEIIAKLNQKRGNYYLNNDIWQAICRVERGKVTNKMRFAIYDRDHYRCRKCGRRTNDLEVDHIIPIAKGGKSTFDNLQTLCHRCNCKKGSSIEY